MIKLMAKISAVIICMNEEKNLDECIRSIKWCDEIILIDSFSTDKSLSIANKYTDKIYQNEWKGFAEQRKFSLTKANYEWIFSLDADERCSEDLSEEIQTILSQNVIKPNGFLIPRKSFFLGRWVKHSGWYPDYQLRLFRKDFVSIEDRLVHESYEVKGEIGKTKNNILHYTVKSISDFIIKINNYSTLSAIENSQKKINCVYILFKPFIEFIKKFVFQGGFLDGVYGVMVAFFHTITKILTYVKIWEIQNKIDK